MTTAAVRTDSEEIDDKKFPPALVTEMLRAFGRAIRAHQLYLPNNPMHARALDTVKAAFIALWKETDTVTVQVTESDMRWLGRPLLE